MNYSITQYGKPLSPDKYVWDAATKTLATTENCLVLDFGGIDEVTFKTGSYCTFITSSCCAFNTGSSCTFNTGFDCIFKTGYNCTFKTGDSCTFSTGYNCTFKTGKNCSLIRWDVDGVIKLLVDTAIKLNGYGIVGYTIVEEKKSCEGKIVEIDGKKYKLVGA
jgi:hypothetical protein